MRALELLNYLGALDDDGDLTPFGQLMSEFPIDPQLAKALMESPKYGCTQEILSIIAMLSVPSPFIRPNNDRKKADEAKSQFEHDDSDHITLLNCYERYKENESDQKWAYDNYLNIRSLRQADNVRKQLEKYLSKINLNYQVEEAKSDYEYYRRIRKALCAGYFMQVAYQEKGGKYSTVKDNQVFFKSNVVCLDSSFMFF